MEMLALQTMRPESRLRIHKSKKDSDVVVFILSSLVITPSQLLVQVKHPLPMQIRVKLFN